MPERPTIEQAASRRALPAVGDWRPQRGDLATDTITGRTGVVISLPEDSGTRVYHLCPEGGGDNWSAYGPGLAPAGSDEADPESLDNTSPHQPPATEGPSASDASGAGEGREL